MTAPHKVDRGAFRFKVERVERIPARDIAVVEGTVLAGSARTGQALSLTHGAQTYPLRLEGVLLGLRSAPAVSLSRISLVFRLRNLAFDVLVPGDELRAGP